MTIERTTVRVAGGELACLRAGAGAARGLVILAHGFPDHPPTFAPIATALAACGLDVVAPWMRGYAPSTLSGPFDADQLGADLLAVANALSAGRPVTLVGHDWGAIATHAALSTRVGQDAIAAAVVMSVPHPLAVLRAMRRGQWRLSWYIGLFQLGLADHIARAGDFALVDRLWRDWSPGLRLAPAERDALHACLAASWPAPIAPYRALFRPVAATRGRLRRARRPIPTPVRYLHGADDGCIMVAAATGQQRWFSGRFEAEIIPGAGHFLHLEAPALVTARIDGWAPP